MASSSPQVDLDWCLGCSKHCSSGEPYCSRECRTRALSDKGSAVMAPFEHVRALDSTLPVYEQIDLKLKKIIEWREQVRPGLDDIVDEDEEFDEHLMFEPSPSVSPRFPLSATALAPPRLALPLPPSPVLLPAADDIESSCPPTLSLSGDDVHDEPLVQTPPNRSVDGAHGPAIRLARSFDDRLKSWLNPGNKAGASKSKTADVEPSALSLMMRTQRRQSPPSVASPSDDVECERPVSRRGRSSVPSDEIPDEGSPPIPIRRRPYRAGADTRLH